jgi:hypothetical protein
MKQSTEDRFWSKVDKSGGQDACWPWTRKPNTGGYGQFSIGRGKNIRVNRAAFLFSGGPIPEGLHVLHKCDNPMCCNPKHLFVGTHADNMADRSKKNRQARLLGEKNPYAKLSNKQVFALKMLRSCGWRQTILATFFSVSQRHVSRICRGLSRTQG